MEKLLLIIKIFITCFFLSSSILAQEKNASESIREKIEEVKSLSHENFLNKIDEFHQEVQKYFDLKKRVCFGEFSTVILREYENAKARESNKPRKLNKEERKRCLRELKSLQTSYINNLFEVRQKYLKASHQKEIESLKQSKLKTLESLQKTFSDKLE